MTIELSSERLVTRNPRHAVLFFLGWLLTSLLVTVVYVRVVRPDLRFWPGMVTHGNPREKLVALTFDDGPYALWTPLLADTLERHGARGTFFVVGMEAQRYQEIIARLVRAGHQVGNHSLTHPESPILIQLSPKRIAAEVTDANKLLSQLTGMPIHDFRPPGGGIDDTLIKVMKRDNLRIAWWSQNIADWNSPAPEVVASRMQRALRPGVVMLLHQREHTVVGLEEFLASKSSAGYTYTTFSQVTQQ
ncbi:MAG: polysaccharide deacetylase family protein [Armatimonadota bacterium]